MPRLVEALAEVKDTDVVVLVLGETGSGKTSFINDYLSSINHTMASTPENNDDEHDLTPRTITMQLTIVEISACQPGPPWLPSGTRLVIVDTPGFGSSTDVHTPGLVADSRLMDEIASWFRGSKATLGGVIHLYDISAPVPSLDSVMSKAFLFNNKLEDGTGLNNTMMVISKWERLGEITFARRMQEVQANWRALTSPNGHADVGALIKHWDFHSDGKGNAGELIDSFPRKATPNLNRAAETKPCKDDAQNHRDSALLKARDTDIVIPVLGATGVGKSTFVNLFLNAINSSQKRAVVGDRLTSCTTDIESVVVEGQTTQGRTRFINLTDEHRLVILDTPGFDQTVGSDVEILRRIAKWLAESHRRRMILGGVIYLYDISQTRPTGSVRQNLEAFERLCEQAVLDKVILVTTMWGKGDNRELCVKREKQLKENHWKGLLSTDRSPGAHVMRIEPCRGEGRSACDVINHVLVQLDKRMSQETLQGVPQFQDELVREEKSVGETAAAKELQEQPQGALSLQGDMSALEKQEALGGVGVEAKIEEVEATLRDLQGAIRASKVSFFSRFIRWRS